jgi:RNA polymerase sigma factor (sigma-70 family)
VILSPKTKEDIAENTLLEKTTAFNDDTRDALLRYLQCLNVRERTVFNMIAIEEYTFAEAAEELHVKKTVVKTYFYRARASLQIMLKKNEKELLKEYNIDK